MKKKRKYFQKLVAVLLVFVMCFSLAPTALAADEDISQRAPDETKQYYMDVTDEEGNIITLLVEENTYYPKTSVTRSTPGDAGGHAAGTIKTVTTKISNGKLTGIGSVGTTLKGAALKVLAKLAAESAVKIVGTSIAGGLGTISVISGLIGAMNAIVGNNGFKVTMKFTWKHFQHKIQGIDLYDWDISAKDIKISTY